MYLRRMTYDLYKFRFNLMMMMMMMTQELPGTVNRLLGTVEYLLHSLLPAEGDCGSVKQRLTTLQRRIDDLLRLFTVRRNNVTLSAQFYSLAQVVCTSQTVYGNNNCNK